MAWQVHWQNGVFNRKQNVSDDSKWNAENPFIMVSKPCLVSLILEIPSQGISPSRQQALLVKSH
jgi:hypothetical protein